jgi:formate-dependent nitrite reductase membrane component NrfD
LTASAMDRSQPIKARTVGRAMVISSICIILGGFLLRAVIIAGGQII